MTAFSKKKFLVATALSAVLGVSVFAGVQPADAASNLMDLFRQKREASQERQAQPDKPIFQARQPARNVQAAPKQEAITNQSAVRKSVTPVKTVSVKGPQIYDYRPEKLVRIDLGKFDPQLTSATDEIVTEADTTAAIMANKAEKVAFQQSYDYLKTLDIKAEQSIAEAIAAFYASEQKLLWSDGESISPKVHEIIDLMARADEHGLDPQDYAVTIPVTVKQSAAASSTILIDSEEEIAQPLSVQQQLSAFDVLFTARVLRYALDAGEGRIIADRLSGFHDLPRNRVNLTDMLKQLLQTSQPTGVLAALHPQNKYYLTLKDQLATLKPDINAVQPVAANTLIRPGQEHAELPKIIDLILAKAPASYISSYSDMLEQHKGSQLYDNQLVAAIKDYQKLLGKTPDGVIGAQTIAAIQGESSVIKRQRLLYAMERLRWLPRDFGERYVFVNQPAYRAQYFEEGNEALAMDVVVGSPRHQTHFFYDNIRTVVFNPSWGVPRSIVMNEMMPRILADSSYLDRNNYEVIVGGKRVPSSSVNWSAVASGKSHVGVRQKPGPNNALGELKIMFPNSHDIYLHDTPSKAAFKRDMRAISHGCIRLADPRAMASAVMSAEKENLTKYFGKNERGIKVPETVPIYLTYFTAWPEENLSEIRYYDDIYQRDAALTKAFEKTSASRLADS